MTDQTNEQIGRVLSAIETITPGAPPLPEVGRRSAIVWKPVLVAAGAFIVALIAVGVAVLLPGRGGDTAAPADAACQATASGETSGVVAGVPWSLSITGQPPNVSAFASIDGHRAGGKGHDAESWGNFVGGTWEWAYVAGRDVAVVFGEVPLDASARVVLADGSTLTLCGAGIDLDYGIGHAVGAFPRDTAIETVEIIDGGGNALGATQLADGLESAGLVPATGTAVDGFTFGFAIATRVDDLAPGDVVVVPEDHAARSLHGLSSVEAVQAAAIRGGIDFVCGTFVVPEGAGSGETSACMVSDQGVVAVIAFDSSDDLVYPLAYVVYGPAIDGAVAVPVDPIEVYGVEASPGRFSLSIRTNDVVIGTVSFGA